MKERIIELYNQGMSIRQISNEVDMSYSGVRMTLVRNGVERRHYNTIKDLKYEEIKSLVDQGKTCKEIGKIYGLTSVSIQNFCFENNIELKAGRKPWL